MRLYHSPGTRSTRVLWLLEEIGEPYELTLLTREQRQSDAHRAVHPLGRVPVLDDGAGPIFESAGLCLHLADRHPDAGLTWPPGTHERALVYQWVLFAMLELEMPIVDLFRCRETHPELAEAAGERFAVAARALDAGLGDEQYLVGGRFSVADVVCGAAVGFAKGVGLLDELPRLAAYADRLDERPAYRRARAIGTT